jgi:NAD(P)-dependent dehydrogenase (short-subunit alcohol dehydrogenase family)
LRAIKEKCKRTTSRRWLDFDEQPSNFTTHAIATIGRYRALVTGAGRGIGLAAAAAFAEAGAHVTLVARNGEEIEAAAKAIRDRGQSADARRIDVTNPESVNDAIASEALFDILLNNAGTNRPAHFTDVTTADFDSIFALNVRSAFFVAQAVARRQIDASIKGSIIHMSSQMGHVGGAKRSVYCASKHALEGLTKAMAIDLAPHGIRVNTICPTFIETPITKPFFENETFRKDVLGRIKLGRLGQVEDLMGAVVFLASDASAMMTGGFRLSSMAAGQRNRGLCANHQVRDRMGSLAGLLDPRAMRRPFRASQYPLRCNPERFVDPLTTFQM